MLKSILSFFLLICFGNLFSQNPYAFTIDKTNGLPSNSVFDIHQDKQGFMWFATGKGLCRYDGTNFKLFTADFQTSKSGSCIEEDKFGRIWYANFDGFLYYVEKGVLKALPQETSLGYFRFGILNNELYLIQPNAIVVFDLKTLKVKATHKITENVISACYTTSKNFYVLGDFLYEIGNATTLKKYTLPNFFHDELVGPIMNNWNNKLIINSKSNNTCYTFENGVFSKLNLNNSAQFTQNTSVIEDDIWICTPNGVYRNNFKTNQTTCYLNEQNVSFVFKDKNHNYWISTLNNGILFIDDFSNNYIDLKPRPVSLSLGKNEIFIGAEKDLIYKLDLKTLKTEQIFQTESNHSVTQIFSDTLTGKLFFNSFKFRILDAKNNLKNEFSIAIKDVKKVDDKYFSFAASSVSGLFYSNPNLKSSWDFLFEKNKNSNFEGFNQSFLINNKNGKSTTYNAFNNTIYYATNNGLIAVTNDGKTEELKFKNTTLFLTKIQSYKDQIIGLSTAEQLYAINAKNEIVVFKLPYFNSNEKFNRFVIINQYCYLFSANGIYEYDLETQKTHKIMSLGSDIEVTDLVLKNDLLYLATSKGIVIKNRTESGSFPMPKLIINEIQINGKRRELNQLKELKPSENDVTIDFSTLSFVPNENYGVTYKINNSDWKKLDMNDQTLKFSSLSPGIYNIQLAIHLNNERVDLQSIQFEIKKPLWLNPIILLGFALIVLTLITSVYNFHIQKLKKRNELQLEKINLEKNLNQSKLKAIKSQMNPHFFYNALNTIQSFILSNDKKQAVTYLSKFSNLTRTILEMTEKETISIAEEAKTLGLYLDIEQARFEEDFSYNILVDADVDTENCKIPTMLLQPYVENAVKHGLLHKQGKKIVTILFQKKKEIIEISIDDNGIGRQKSAELNALKNKNHHSFATEATENRIDLLNQYNQNNISIQYLDKTNLSNQPTGTTVVFEIPITY